MKKVLLIDSGSGGVNVLRECVRVCPHCNYLLFCDSLHLPYGEKSKRELLEITKDNLESIKKIFDYEIVILACNTLSATILPQLREDYPNITFIGTVPAINPALTEFDENDILVIATSATIAHNELLKKHERVKKLALPKLANLIDENLDNLEVVSEYLKSQLTFPFRAVVLGCTHYFSIANIIEREFGVKTFKSDNGVARRLLSFISEKTGDYQVQILSNNESDLGKFCWFYQNF